MRIQELIEQLEQMNPDAEVRFASQPSWPFEYSIDAVYEVDPKKEEEVERPWSDPEKEKDNEEDETVVYLVENRQIGYLPGYVKDIIGW